MANNVDPDQTALLGAVCSGSTLFASILNLSVMLGKYLQQTTQQTTFSDALFPGALRVKARFFLSKYQERYYKKCLLIQSLQVGQKSHCGSGRH